MLTLYNKTSKIEHMETLTNFQSKITQIRKDSGLTQDEFAAKLFVTRQAVSRWENGETTPNIETLKKLIEVFNLDANTIFFGDMCQSCSMPLTKETDYGTNADGGASDDYCSHCYSNGQFIAYCSLEEVIADSVNYCQYAGLTPDQMLAYARENYPKLKRWKKES